MDFFIAALSFQDSSESISIFPTVSKFALFLQSEFIISNLLVM